MGRRRLGAWNAQARDRQSVGNEGSRPSDFGRPPGKRIDKTIGTSGASSGVSR